MAQEVSLPPFDLAALDTQLPGLRRTLSNDSDMSPLSSAAGSQYGDPFPPTSDPMNMPRSVPLGLGDSISNMGRASFSQQGMGFPAAWQLSPEQSLLQFSSPELTDSYLSVSDLANQIFQEPMGLGSDASLFPTPPPPPTSAPPTSVPVNYNSSIDAIVNGPTAPLSPIASTASSPRPLHGPKYLYRSDSGSGSSEPRLQALAAEIGMSARLMSQCIKQYFRFLYPIMPILHEQSLRNRLMSAEELTIDEKVLLLSLCAITVTHAAPPSDLTMNDKHNLGKQFMKQCFHLRHLTDFIETATLTTIISSFFICIAHFELKLPRSHHFYLREAIGLAREMHIDSDKFTSDPVQGICAKRMMALLFVTERGAAILRNKPVSIIRLNSVPTDYFDEQDQVVLAGFTSLCSLFSLLDDDFVEVWHASEDELLTVPLSNVAQLQHNLNDMTFDESKMTEIQKSDVLITHQWLRLIFWQASMRNGLITSTTNDPVFWYNYPIKIAQDLAEAMRTMDYESILVHGLGIFEKIFEVAYTLMDALTIAKVDWSTSEDLRYLFACLSASPNSHSTYVKVLENKMDTAAPSRTNSYPASAGPGSPLGVMG